LEHDSVPRSAAAAGGIRRTAAAANLAGGALPGIKDAGQAGARTIPLLMVYFFWVLMVVEIEQFASATIGGPFFRLPTLFAPVLALVTLALARNTRALYWPLLVFVALHFGASVLATNAGISRLPTKYMFYVLLLFASSVTFLNSPPKITVVLKLYLLSYLWFALQGLPDGLVSWHQLMSNEDSFGPLMVLGMPVAYFFALSVISPRWKWCARIAFLACLLGLVASFARGAALAGAAVLLFTLYRSPHKTKALLGVGAVVIVAVPLMVLLMPMEAYLAEIMTSGEGDPVRMNLWRLAIQVFETSPLFGVGASNFGVVADQIASVQSRAMIWGGVYFRTIHNPTLQILAEEGLVGITCWITMIISFFRWNAFIRKKASRDLWVERGGSEIDVGMLSNGLDVSMVGFLLTSVFYNQLYIHWFWSLLTISYVLYWMTKPTRVGPPARVVGLGRQRPVMRRG